MSIAAANVAPSFLDRRDLKANDLRHLEEPAVIFEHHGWDSDGEEFFVYTVGGMLNDEWLPNGCTVGGQAILIHATSREEADAIATMGLHDTILALDGEETMYQEAHAALARLASVGPLERLDQAIKPASDKSDAFVEDVDAVRPLIGDDIVLAAGRVE